MGALELTADLVGVCGAITGLAAYFLLQKQILTATGGWYLGMNLLSPLLVMLSLLVHWNLSAFLLQLAWALISLYGLHRHVWRVPS